MICPKCGSENPDSALKCNQCYYKFKFEHAHGDPSKKINLDFSGKEYSATSTSAKISRWIVIILVIIITIWIISKQFNLA